MNAALRREWGAVTFVATVLVGAVAVAISLIITGGSHGAGVAPPPPCPSVTPYAAASVAASPASSSAPHSGADATPARESFNPALANCPTPAPAPRASETPAGPAASASGPPAVTSAPPATPTPIAISANPKPLP